METAITGSSSTLASTDWQIATSDLYNSKASAKNGIESVRENAKGATLDDTTGE